MFIALHLFQINSGEQKEFAKLNQFYLVLHGTKGLPAYRKDINQEKPHKRQKKSVCILTPQHKVFRPINLFPVMHQSLPDFIAILPSRQSVRSKGKISLSWLGK